MVKVVPGGHFCFEVPGSSPKKNKKWQTTTIWRKYKAKYKRKILKVDSIYVFKQLVIQTINLLWICIFYMQLVLFNCPTIPKQKNRFDWPFPWIPLDNTRRNYGRLFLRQSFSFFAHLQTEFSWSLWKNWKLEKSRRVVIATLQHYKRVSTISVSSLFLLSHSCPLNILQERKFWSKYCNCWDNHFKLWQIRAVPTRNSISDSTYSWAWSY